MAPATDSVPDSGEIGLAVQVNPEHFSVMCGLLRDASLSEVNPGSPRCLSRWRFLPAAMTRRRCSHVQQEFFSPIRLHSGAKYCHHGDPVPPPRGGGGNSRRLCLLTLDRQQWPPAQISYLVLHYPSATSKALFRKVPSCNSKLKISKNSPHMVWRGLDLAVGDWSPRPGRVLAIADTFNRWTWHADWSCLRLFPPPQRRG